MSTELLQAPLHPSQMGPTALFVKETREAMLAYEIADLAALRFSILLTVRWEAAHDQDPQQCAELRSDLAILRGHYDAKIDEIALTFGVEDAMKAQEDVERTVVVPRDMQPLAIEHDKQLSSEENGESGYGL